MMKKRFYGGLILLAVVCLLGGCLEGAAKTVSMYDLRVAMLEADDSFPEMLSVSDEDVDAEHLFSYVSDISYDKVEHFFLSYSKEGLADELVVVTAKNTDDLAEIKGALEAHKESRIKLYQQYLPKEQKRAEDGMIFTKGLYVVLIISDQTDAVKAAFETMVET